MLFLLSSNVYSQDENVVSGKVFPAGMQTPMRDVTVQIQGDASSIVLTDGNGVFSMKVASFPVDLVFMKKTYQMQVVNVKKASDLTIYMQVPEKTVTRLVAKDPLVVLNLPQTVMAHLNKIFSSKTQLN